MVLGERGVEQFQALGRREGDDAAACDAFEVVGVEVAAHAGVVGPQAPRQ